jgi:ABC-type phosphate transport system permease subunit
MSWILYMSDLVDGFRLILYLCAGVATTTAGYFSVRVFLPFLYQDDEKEEANLGKAKRRLACFGILSVLLIVAIAFIPSRISVQYFLQEYAVGAPTCAR